MKIKRYTASSMRSALALVRAEQGPDAVILSSRRGEEGIEVIAAVDYDAALFAAARQQRAEASGSAEPAPADAAASKLDQAIEAALAARPSSRRETPADAVPPAAGPAAPQAAAGPRPSLLAPRPRAPAAAASTPSPSPTLPVPAPAATPVSPPAPAARARRAAPHPVPAAAEIPVARAAVPPAGPLATPAGAPAPNDIAYQLMQRELKEMRYLLETGMAGMTWNDKRLREPLKAQILEALSAIDIAPDVALSIAELAPRRTNLDDTRNIPLALLVKMLPFIDDTTSLSGGVTALVGPTGAGKTTTIAKLAARWCLTHGSRDLALVSTDAYRIGAREQLMTYARILDTTMYTANTGRELGRLMERLSHKKLVLIDTAGMGPRDERLTEQLAALKLGAGQAKVLLALPAQAEGQALDDIVRAYARANPSACIITKVDEAASLGGVLSAIVRHKLKIAYVCDGQRIPDDLHAAQQRRIWLVKAAQKMKRDAPRLHDEAYLAKTFGRTSAHA